MKINEEALKNKRRRDIYNYILLRPGMHFNEICRIFKMQKNNLNYHLNILQKEGLISVSAENGYKHYYIKRLNEKRSYNIAKILAKYCYKDLKPEIVHLLFTYKKSIPDKKERKIINLLRNPVTSNIVKFLYINPGSTRRDISNYLKKHPTTVSFHLDKLNEVNIIKIVKDGKKVRYDINNLAYIFMLYLWINTHKPIVSSNGEPSGYDGFHWLNSFIDIFYEIFPHPYHV